MKEYPESQAVKVWSDGEVTYSIVQHPRYGHYCGYCRFLKRPLKEEGYSGIATYVPVHGGITYAEESKDGSMVYGFDCGHSGDAGKPELLDLDWLSGECVAMATGIKEAAKVEDDYLLAETSERKADILDAYHVRMREVGITFNMKDNFMAMLKGLCGDL
jgi:hypothetical protein